MAVILVIALYLMYTHFNNNSAFFYGFAQNKEMEINYNRDVLVEKVFVTPGQKVKKGDLLLIVQDASIPAKIKELKLKKEAISVDSHRETETIRNKIKELKFEKEKKLSEIDRQINELENKIEVNKSLYEGLKSLSFDSGQYVRRSRLQLDYLTAMRKRINDNYTQEIRFQDKLLEATGKPSNIKTEIIDAEIEHYEKEKENLKIYAPMDGLIGNVLCKKGEYVSAFKSFMDFYQTNPTLVKGYVHESLLLRVKAGNKLWVSSSMHPSHRVLGVVTGLGSRIVEIPERLRKIPEVKSYGREVLVKIPFENKFLQKEKVMLMTVDE